MTHPLNLHAPAKTLTINFTPEGDNPLVIEMEDKDCHIQGELSDGEILMNKTKGWIGFKATDMPSYLKYHYPANSVQPYHLLLRKLYEHVCYG